RTLGLAYLRSQQFAQAETAFRKIVALAPDQALGYANLGLVQLRQGRYVEAEREIRRAAALDTASDDIALTLAKVYELTGRTAEARRAVDRVLRRSPRDRGGDPLQRRDDHRWAPRRAAAPGHRHRGRARDRRLRRRRQRGRVGRGTPVPQRAGTRHRADYPRRDRATRSGGRRGVRRLRQRRTARP